MWLATNEAKRAMRSETDSISSKQEIAQAEKYELDKNLIDAIIEQIEKRNIKASPIIKDEDGKIKAMIITENLAPLFANYENKLNITVATGNKANQAEVSLTGGSIKKVEDYYIAIPDGSMDKVTLTVKQNGKKLVENQYNVVSLPTPKAFLTYKTTSGKLREYRSNVPMTSAELASINEIKLKMDAGIHTGEEVQGFDMILIKNGNKTVITEHAQGAVLTKKMKQILAHVVKGDKLFFTNITVKGKHTQPRQTVSLNVIPM